MNQVSGTSSTANAEGIDNGALFGLMTAAFLMAWQSLHSFSTVLLKVLWSNEGKAIFGNSVFYPTVAMTVLFMVARLVPRRIVTTCACFCKRKALLVWKKIRMMMAKSLNLASRLLSKRAQIWASFRVVIGALEILCL